MKAATKKADEIHDYYIKLEEILQETIGARKRRRKQCVSLEKTKKHT